MEPLFKKRLEHLCGQLPPDIGAAILEHGEELGRRFLRTIPFNRALTLNDRTMIAALCIRTFQVGRRGDPFRGPTDRIEVPRTRCLTCGERNVTALHGDTCTLRFNPGSQWCRWAAVHDRMSHVLATHLKYTPGSTVSREDSASRDGNRQRTDINVTGGAAPDGTRRAYDITLLSKRVNTGVSTNHHSIPDETHTSSVDRARRLLQRRLELREQDKRNRYRHVGCFVPLVLTISGTKHPLSLIHISEPTRPY